LVGITGTGTVTDSGAAANLTINNTTPSNFAGLLTGTLNLVKSGAGTLTLGKANSYTGRKRINAGTLANGVANAIPITTVLADNATFDLAGFAQQLAGITGTGVVTDSGAAADLTINNTTPSNFAGLLTGTLNLVKSGAGTLTLG